MTEANGKEVKLMKLGLTKSVVANGEEVMELQFREPSGGDIMRCGNPVSVDFAQDPPKITYEPKAMTQMLALLGTVPPSTIERLTARDWETAALMITNFFLPDLSKIQF